MTSSSAIRHAAHENGPRDRRPVIAHTQLVQCRADFTEGPVHSRDLAVKVANVLGLVCIQAAIRLDRLASVDGVPFPVMQWAVQSGAVPHIRRWLASGAYRLREWTPQMPCTTPASQLGILHGTVDRIPAFRWYDRELDRLLVATMTGHSVASLPRARVERRKQKPVGSIEDR